MFAYRAEEPRKFKDIIKTGKISVLKELVSVSFSTPYDLSEEELKQLDDYIQKKYGATIRKYGKKLYYDGNGHDINTGEWDHFWYIDWAD